MARVTLAWDVMELAVASVRWWYAMRRLIRSAIDVFVW